MQEDTVVDLPRKRVYFQENQTLILKKPNLTDPQFRDPYEKLIEDIED
jgi:negative regulator of replication initiation